MCVRLLAFILKFRPLVFTVLKAMGWIQIAANALPQTIAQEFIQGCTTWVMMELLFL